MTAPPHSIMKAMALLLVIALAAVGICGEAATVPAWSVARTPHFELYTQADQQTARSTLMRFEELRAFLAAQTGLRIEGRPPVRVIEFASPNEYEPYRLRPTSDAYYVGTESQD